MSKDYIFQFFAAFASAMCQWGIGSMLGYSGVVLPLLTDSESDDMILNKAQASLFGKTSYNILISM